MQKLLPLFTVTSDLGCVCVFSAWGSVCVWRARRVAAGSDTGGARRRRLVSQQAVQPQPRPGERLPPAPYQQHQLLRPLPTSKTTTRTPVHSDRDSKVYWSASTLQLFFFLHLFLILNWFLRLFFSSSSFFFIKKIAEFRKEPQKPKSPRYRR